MSPVTGPWIKWADALKELIPDGKVRATARACAAADAGKRSEETWRTYLMRYRRGPSEPEEEQARIIAKALRMPRKKLPAAVSRHDRLRSLEEHVAVLQSWVALGFESLGVEPGLEDEARRAVNGDNLP